MYKESIEKIVEYLNSIKMSKGSDLKFEYEFKKRTIKRASLTYEHFYNEDIICFCFRHNDKNIIYKEIRYDESTYKFFSQSKFKTKEDIYKYLEDLFYESCFKDLMGYIIYATDGNDIENSIGYKIELKSIKTLLAE